MAKFCGNCGAQQEDNARVCGYCGTPLAASAPPAAGAEATFTPVDPQKKARIMTFVKIGIAVVAVVVAAVLAWNIVSAFTGYRGMVRKFYRAVEAYDIDTLTELTSDLTIALAGDPDDEAIYELLSDNVSDMLDTYEEEVGHDLEIDYEITETYELSERRLEELLDELEYYDLDTSTIDDFLMVEASLTLSGSRREMTTTDELLLVKEDGEWRVFATESTW